RAHERERAWIRKAPGERRRDVDDDAHARFRELFGRDSVDVGVIDDRDVVGGEPLDEVLGAAVELRLARELDEAHVLPTLDRNSPPPSIPSRPWRASGPSSCWVPLGARS